MGCGQSSNQIGISSKCDNAPGTAPGTPLQGTPTKRGIKTQKLNSKTIRVKGSQNQLDNSDMNIPINDGGDDLETGTPKNNKRKLLLKQNTWTGSVESLVSNIGREGSATSKFSHHSTDSGFGGDNAYKHFITENSDPAQIKDIEDEFNTPRELG